ncbi:unnamed protein product [Symbiodinium pilosum]|uniref:EF-hand domain-containing protein n=1 Tax=Symbiodinium pilosum TaxID=2952 RepID=A0A812KM51_SYMPI|nr:unnamed protein product [Symbiodinium pilosum]
MPLDRAAPARLHTPSDAGSEHIRIVKTQQLVNYFQTNYSSFLGGLLADHGAPQPTPMCGTTLKSFTCASPRPHRDVDFEGRYRPTSGNGRRREQDQGTAAVPLSARAHGGHGSSLQVLESPRTPGRNHPLSTRPRGKVKIDLSKDYGKDPGPESNEVASKDDDELRKREASESLRMLVLGTPGANAEHSDKEWAAQHRRGTNEEVETFCRCWCQMDADNDGDVDLEEFANFFSKRKVDRLLGMRCIRYLMPRAASQGKTLVSKDDMMRLLWPYATAEDMDYMCIVFDHCRLCTIAVQPPKLLPRKRRTELLKCFQEMDRNHTGLVPYNDLIPAGVADQNMVKVLRDKYDITSSGFFDKNSFLEMMAPLGYRAHESMRFVVLKDGKRVRFIEWSREGLRFEGWLTERHYEKLKEHYGFEDDAWAGD